MRDRKASVIRKVVDWILGLSLIALGLIGGFVPLLQGWIFVLAGLAVLSSHSRWARAILDGIRGLVRRVRDRIKGSSLDR